MQAFLSQLPALLGVLIGAGAAYLSASAAERTRWKRAQSVRWDEKRLGAYVDHAAALKKVFAITLRLASDAGLTAAAEPLPRADGLALLAEAEEQRTVKWEALLLLGSEDVIIAGRRWRESARRLQLVVFGDLSAESWSDAIADASRARRDFYEAAKRDIGVAISGPLETYDWQMGSMPA